MFISYRTRRLLRRAATVFLAIFIVCVLFILCWSSWVERYIIYTRDGIVFDFDMDYQIPEGIPAVQSPASDVEVSIYFNEGDNALELNTELTQLKGYYITTSDIASDAAGQITAVKSLPSGTAVMVELKGGKGSYYYSSSMSGATMADIDLNLADELIHTLTKGDYYAIARVSAFQDYYFGLNYVDEGLPYAGGTGYLWMDDEGCYWLRPDSTKVLNNLIALVEELKGLGFDEVVFTDFCFPDTNKVTYTGDKAEALTKAMDTLITNCNTSSFCVSFSVTDHTLAVPDGRSRLYLEKVSAQNVAAVAAQVSITEPETRLVFVADTNDTRFDNYGVLRAIATAAEQSGN